jgi:hypothetical protein
MTAESIVGLKCFAIVNNCCYVCSNRNSQRLVDTVGKYPHGNIDVTKDRKSNGLPLPLVGDCRQGALDRKGSFL